MFEPRGEKLMWGARVGTAVAGLISVGIGYIGVQYLRAPVATAPSFVGSTEPDPAVFLGNAKGVRDLLSGVAIATLLLTGQRRAAGWFVLAAASIPTGDMLVVLGNRGAPATALGVHGATAAAAVLSGVLLVRAGDPPPHATLLDA